MGKASYIGVSSKAHKIKKGYIGVGGKARKIKKAYIGVNGKARLWWTSGVQQFIAFSDLTGHTIDLNGNVNNFTMPRPSQYGFMSTINYANGIYFACGIGSGIICSYSRDLNTWTNLQVNSTYSVDSFIGTLVDNDHLYVLWLYNSYYLIVATIDTNTLQVVSEINTNCVYCTTSSSKGGFAFAPDGKNIIFQGKINTNETSGGKLCLYNVSNKTTITFNSTTSIFRLYATTYYEGKTVIDYEGIGQYCTDTGTITRLGNLTGISPVFNYLYHNNIVIAAKSRSLVKSINFGEWQTSELTLPMSSTSVRTRRLVYGDGKYLLYLWESPHNYIYTSTDGLTWTRLTTEMSIKDMCYSVPRGYGDN